MSFFKSLFLKSNKKNKMETEYKTINIKTKKELLCTVKDNGLMSSFLYTDGMCFNNDIIKVIDNVLNGNKESDELSMNIYCIEVNKDITKIIDMLTEDEEHNTTEVETRKLKSVLEEYVGKSQKFEDENYLKYISNDNNVKLRLPKEYKKDDVADYDFYAKYEDKLYLGMYVYNLNEYKGYTEAQILNEQLSIMSKSREMSVITDNQIQKYYTKITNTVVYLSKREGYMDTIVAMSTIRFRNIPNYIVYVVQTCNEKDYEKYKGMFMSNLANIEFNINENVTIIKGDLENITENSNYIKKDGLMIELDNAICFGEILKEYNYDMDSLIDFSIGYDDKIYVLLKNGWKSKYCDEINGSKYSMIVLDIEWNECKIKEVGHFKLGTHKKMFYHIQPIMDKILLVGSDYLKGEYKSNYSEDEVIPGTTIVEYSGEIFKELSFGECINDCIVLANGNIITSYGDEGIFGIKPASGLTVWNIEGNPIWDTNRNMAECYAINIDENDNLWYYYYDDFNLIYTDLKNEKVYNPQICYADGFLLNEKKDCIIFIKWNREQLKYNFLIGSFIGENVGNQRKLEFEYNNENIKVKRFRCRKSKAVFIDEKDRMFLKCFITVNEDETMRDKIKDKSYFEEYLRKKLDRINELENTMKTLDEDNIEGKRNGHIILSQHYREVIYAMYSIGENIENIRKQYEKLIPHELKSVSKETGTFKTIELVALAVLFEYKDECILDIVNNSGINDKLLDIYLKYLFPSYENKYTDTIYSDLIGYASNNNISALEIYLNKTWYKKHKSADWYDSDKSKYPVYTGYWAFDVAALVKIMSVDDNELKKCNYYPYDMVNYNR